MACLFCKGALPGQIQYNMPDITIIIPVLNEEENILPLALELTQTFSEMSWECIWVDDGSCDSTSANLEQLVRSDERHHALVLEAHAGKSAALHAGCLAAQGTIICMLDGDGQNDPADLSLFIEILQAEKVDLVAGYRLNRQDNWVKRFSSFVGNRFRNAITGHTVRDTGCATRVMKKSSLMTLPFFSGMHRFIPTLFAMNGYRIIEAPANHRPRLRGCSKYGIGNRLGTGLIDCFGVLWLSKKTLTYRISRGTPDVSLHGGHSCRKGSG